MPSCATRRCLSDGLFKVGGFRGPTTARALRLNPPPPPPPRPPSARLLCSQQTACYDQGWSANLAAAWAFIAVYPIGVLALFLGVLALFARRGDLGSENVRAAFGLLYDAYRPAFWWFEVRARSFRVLSFCSHLLFVGRFCVGLVQGGVPLILAMPE